MQLPDYSYVYEEQDEQLRREIMRQLCQRDLWFLARHVLGFEDLELRTDIHLRLCRELDEHPLRYLILIPRDYFKTSLMMAHCVRLLCADNSHEIGIGSDTDKRAQDRVNDLREMLKTPLLVDLFPECFFRDPDRESNLWTKSAFNIRRPLRGEMRGGFKLPSVTAFGFDPMPTGSHYSFVWIDDLENDDNSKNEDQIEKLNHNLRAFFPILPPKSPVVMTGTIWAGDGKKGTGPHTTYQNIEHWKVYKRKVRTGDGRYPNRPTFPSRHPEEELRRKEAEVNDPYLWAGQYHLEYRPRTGTQFFPFRGVSFDTFQFLPTPEGGTILRGSSAIELVECNVYVTVDPSGGTGRDQAHAKTDKVGWAVNAVSSDGQWHFLEIGEEYLTDPQFIDKLFLLYHWYRPEVIGIEKMLHLETALRQAFQLRHETLPIGELRPRGRQKSARIRGLRPLCGSIYLREGRTDARYFTNYYTAIDHGDDAIDAVAYQVDIARAPSPWQIQSRREARLREWENAQLNALPPTEKQEWSYWIKKDQEARRPVNQEQRTWEEIYGGDNVQTQYHADLDARISASDYFTTDYDDYI